MSYHVEALCDRRKFGSATRKQIVMYLANKASDDGTGIWCSKHTIAKHTELSLATVKRVVREFIAEGILVATGMRQTSAHGQTVVYRIVLEVVGTLEPLRPEKGSVATGVTANPVQPTPPTGVTVTPRPGSERPPNNPNNNPMNPPPPRAGAREAEEADLEKVWEAYPADRRRDRTTCLRRMPEVLGEVSPDELLAAVRAYAAESEGFTRSKVSFLDNWLRDGKWRRHVEELRRRKAEAEAAAEKQLVQVAAWVKARHGMCKHVTQTQVAAAVERGLISRQEAQAAGFMR